MIGFEQIQQIIIPERWDDRPELFQRDGLPSGILLFDRLFKNAVDFLSLHGNGGDISTLHLFAKLAVTDLRAILGRAYIPEHPVCKSHRNQQPEQGGNRTTRSPEVAL
jgi:hypothetical protein